jgi:hypothetical protein
MSQRMFQLTIAGLLSLTLLFATSLNADTILVGTSLSGTAPGPELCPLPNDCQNRFSQFSSPQPFEIEDVKVVISGPTFNNVGTSGDFQVFLDTQPGSVMNVSTAIGTGHLTFNPSDPQSSDVQVFDFSGLNIPILANTNYYLQVDGGNLDWNTASPLIGTLGTLGLQLDCDPTENCSLGVSHYNSFKITYAQQISGDPITTAEPSTLLLFATGLFSAGILTVRGHFKEHQ